MAKNKGKTLVFNTLLLIFCCVIVGLYCLNPIKDDVLKTHFMSFDSEGGTAIQALEFPECSTLEEPANPTREGYIFKGWTLNGEPFDFSQEVCGDVELKAVWEEQKPEVKYITIYISLGDGSENSPVVIEEGTIPTKPSDPTRENYKFTGWKYNGQPYNFDTPLPDGAVINATWEEVKKEEPEKPEEPEDDNQEFTVKFNLNGGKAGGTCTDQKVKKNATAKNVCKPTREGYTLTGWSPSISTKVTKNLTFVAQWKKNATPGGDTPGGGGNTTYTIRFNTDGGTSCSDYTGKLNDKFSLSRCKPTKKYRTLSGWTYGGKNYGINAQYTITGNAMLTAVWDAAKYSVSCSTANGISDSTCQLSFGGGLSREEVSKVKITYMVGGIKEKNMEFTGLMNNVDVNAVWNQKKSITITIKNDNLSHQGTW